MATATTSVDQLFAALATGDVDRCVDLFSPDGSVEDPAGSRPYRGRRELRSYFEGLLQALESPAFAVVDAVVDRPGVAVVTWTLETGLHGGGRASSQGRHLVATDGQGRLRSVLGLWRPADLVPAMEGPL